MDFKKKVLLIHWKLPYFFRKLIYSIYSLGMKIVIPLIVLKMNKGKFLNKEIKKIDDTNYALEFALSFKYLAFSLKTAQIKYEILKLLEILKKLKPKIVLEIGTAGGGTFFLFTRIADSDATLISVDLPGGKYGGGYAEWKIPLYQTFGQYKQKIKLVRADSHNPKTLELVKNYLNNRMVDFLFIDGDHTYKGVKKDFEMYSKLVKKGGIIAFHDIAKPPSAPSYNVNKFWNEIKTKYQTLEIIEDINQNWAGIGVIYF